MKPRSTLTPWLPVIALFLGLLVSALPAAPQETAAPLASPQAAVTDLHWLAGTWHGTIQGIPGVRRFEATYTPADGGLVLGTSKAFNEDGQLAFFEFERFELRDGKLVVTPYPNGKESVSFTLSSLDPAARKAVFSNPEHDFPKEISYQRTAEDRVQFLVSGNTEDGRLQIDLTRKP